MTRHTPPDRYFTRWLLGMTLAILPLAGIAEVTLNTTVVRISTSLPAPDPAGSSEIGATDGADLPSEVFTGDVLRYTIVFENTSTQDVAAGSVVITNPLPADTVYIEGSALGEDTFISFSVDGETFAAPGELLVGQGAQVRAATAADYRAIRWAYEPVLPAGAVSEVSFELLIP